MMSDFNDSHAISNEICCTMSIKESSKVGIAKADDDTKDDVLHAEKQGSCAIVSKDIDTLEWVISDELVYVPYNGNT